MAKDAKVRATRSPAICTPPSLTLFLAGGKAKPLKQPKKDKKDLDEDELEFKAKQAADAKARKEMADKAKGKGPMNAGQQGKSSVHRYMPDHIADGSFTAGIKKSGKK